MDTVADFLLVVIGCKAQEKWVLVNILAQKGPPGPHARWWWNVEPLFILLVILGRALTLAASGPVG